MSEGQYITISLWCLGAALPHTFWTFQVVSVAGVSSMQTLCHLTSFPNCTTFHRLPLRAAGVEVQICDVLMAAYLCIMVYMSLAFVFNVVANHGKVGPTSLHFELH